MTRKSIVFAVNEAGSFAYLLPLLMSWSNDGQDTPDFDLVVSSDVENFALFKTHQADLPLVSVEDALCKEYDLAVCSAINAPNFVTEVASRAQYKIAFLDIWSKVWSPTLHTGFDAIAVIDSAHQDIARGQGWPGNVEVVGQPAWEGIERLPEADTHKILFASQPIDKFYGMSLGYNEASIWEGLVEAFSDCADVTLTYAVHPAENEADLPQGATFNHDVQEALKTHGTVVSAFSSVILDAWLMGRKTISFQPNLKGEDKCYLSEIGAVPLACDADALMQAYQQEDFKGSGIAPDFKDSTTRFSRLITSYLSEDENTIQAGG